MLYFDAHACVGQRPFKHKRTRWSTEHLLEDMALAEISGALISHGLAQSYDPLYGNRRVGEETKKASEKLFPLWCVLPLGSVDFYSSAEKMLQSMEEAFVCAVSAGQLLFARSGYGGDLRRFARNTDADALVRFLGQRRPFFLFSRTPIASPDLARAADRSHLEPATTRA